MSARIPRTILLDLDGTLVDPRQGFIASIRHALEALGCPAPDDDALARYIGPPLQSALLRLLGDSRAAAVPEAVRLYRERYQAGAMFEQTVYPGIPQALDDLRLAGATLLLATSKAQAFAQCILEHRQLADRFIAVYGSEFDGTRADKRELIRHILAREPFAAADAVMIGDRAEDIRAARVNGMRSVGALWGYGSREELAAAGATAFCAAPSDLLDVLADLTCVPAT